MDEEDDWEGTPSIKTKREKLQLCVIIAFNVPIWTFVTVLPILTIVGEARFREWASKPSTIVCVVVLTAVFYVALIAGFWRWIRHTELPGGPSLAPAHPANE